MKTTVIGYLIVVVASTLILAAYINPSNGLTYVIWFIYGVCATLILTKFRK